MIKAVSSEIAAPLQILINTAIETGVVPLALKIAKVVPVFKKGDQKNIEHYRPITVQSVFSKVFEIFLYDRMVDFLNKYQLLCNDQHGFTLNKSTEMAGVEIVQVIHQELDLEHAVAGLFFDLSRAFDTSVLFGVSCTGNKSIMSFF